MRILVLSGEVWRDDLNGGNVLSNLLKGLNAEVAQVFCNPGEPDNKVCKRYYQITDRMVIHNFLGHKPIGKEIVYDDYPCNNGSQEKVAEQPNKKMYAFFHAHRLEVFYYARNFLWNHSNWKNDGFKKFIDDFNPDIIFAPCYGNKFLLRMTRFVAERTGKKVISYVYDDVYTLHQFRFSLFYWLTRFSVRRQLRKTFPYYSLVYTMTETQKEQCERDFGANMKILRKAWNAEKIPDKVTVNTPIKLVYAGGIYLNRHKTLAKIAEAIKKINKDGIKMTLDIYTANEITDKMVKLLGDGVHSRIHSAVSREELIKIYSESDIALHVESFKLKNRLEVRMSFSTKIVDCLASSAATMAICDPLQGGYRYLKENDIAICVPSPKEIEKALRDLCENPDKILDYAKRAKECVKKNHDETKTEKMLREDFEALL